MHLEQTVAIVVPISSVSTVVAVKVYMPLCMVNHLSVLGFWPAIQQLSEFAYLAPYDDCTQRESQELLAGLSSWAAALLPVIKDGEHKSALKLLGFLGTCVMLSSGTSGILSGWSAHRWLISVRGGLLWAQSADIRCQTY
jgi:hypothetical protein